MICRDFGACDDTTGTAHLCKLKTWITLPGKAFASEDPKSGAASFWSPVIRSSNSGMNIVCLRILTCLARVILVGVSLLLFITIVLTLLVDIGNRTTAVTSWPPSDHLLRSLVLLICLPIHTTAAVRHWHHTFPLYAVLSTITASFALIGTDAGTFFVPTALSAAFVLYVGTRWRQP